MPFARQWEDRFGADALLPLMREAATQAIQAAGLQPADLTTVIADGSNARTVKALPRALGLKPEQVADDLAAVLEERLEHLLEVQHLRLIVHQRHAVDAEHRLQLGLRVEVVEHHLARLPAA